MKVCCVFSLESPRRGDSNEYTQYTIYNIQNTVTHRAKRLITFDQFTAAA